MFSISLCHAAQDAAIAAELSAYLGRNFGSAPDRAVIGLQYELIEAADIALSADAAILLLSSAAVQGIGNREQWEPVLIEGPKAHGSVLVSVQIEECRFPPLLRRKDFFDARTDRLNVFRALKARLIEARTSAYSEPLAPEPVLCTGSKLEIEPLRREISDSPGTMSTNDPELARAFASRCAGEFEFTLWVDCEGRSVVSVTGEIGSRAGSAGYADRRGLIILEDPAPDVASRLENAGLTSVLIINGGRIRPAPDQNALEAAVSDVLNGRGVRVDEAALYRASRRPGGSELAMLSFRYFTRQSRMPEAIEALETAERLAIAARDLNLVEECRRERRWMDGHAGAPTASTQPAQLQFDW